MKRLCECGCGKEVAHERNRFIHGHNQKGIKLGPRSEEHKARIKITQLEKKNAIRQLCACGCGELAKKGNRFINGHHRKGKKFGPLSEEHKAKVGAGNEGKILSEGHKAKISATLKITPRSKEHTAKLIAATTYNLKDWQEKWPFLFIIEEIKEEHGKIWVHCTNSNCSNSKESDGWFNPTGLQLYNRARSLRNEDDTSCFYCTDHCKRTCRKFGKTAKQLQKEDELAAGIQPSTPVLPYTSAELEVFRQEVLERDNYKCIYCDESATHVHHMRPQKLEPFFALDPDYAISCCDKCHYKYGHKTGTECSTGALANTTCTKPILFLEQEYCAATKEEQNGLPF
jgi:hypothetical protein